MRVAQQIADQLKQAIEHGTYQSGDRLPAERVLAQQFRVSRSSVREAIQALVSEGFLSVKAGGGTFVQRAQDKPVNSIVVLFRDNPEYRFDALEVRHALEGNAAFYAALRATDEDKAQIQANYERMIALHGSDDPIDEAVADAIFHLSIVEASHNLVLLHVMRDLFELLQRSVSHNLDKLYTLPRVFEPLKEQHFELLQAVLAGDPERARQAAQNHLVFVEESLKNIDADEARKARSLGRLSRVQF